MPDDIDAVISPLPATAAAEPASTPATTPAPELKTAEQFATDKKVPAWLFAAMRAGERWPFGQQMTEDAFDAVLKKTNSLTIGR